MDLSYFKNSYNTDITLCACVYRIKKASGVTFVTLRHGRYMLQAIYIPDICKTSISELCEGAYIKAQTSVKEEKRAEHGFELTLKDFDIISKPVEEYPINVSRPDLGCTLDDNINMRSLSLRHPKERAIMEIRDRIVSVFADFMRDNSYTHITTPKISPYAADNDYIRVKYFGKDASLVKTNVPYLINVMGGFDKVYETGTVFSSKNSNSLRSLNEFTMMSYETAFISESTDITDFTSAVINHIIDRVSKECEDEVNILGVSLPHKGDTPSITFSETMSILDKPQTRQDLDPTDEVNICRHAYDTYGTDFVFVTNLPSQRRPFYEKDGYGFVLLFKGVEIASGGIHISDYQEQRNKLAQMELNPEDFESFLDSHKYALPPIGGASIGLERFIMQLLNLDNIRKAVPFPRDMHYMV